MSVNKLTKTNAARLLDRAGIGYELRAYEVDENDLSAANVAHKLGVGAGLLFKTLVLRGDRTGIFVCLIPGDTEVDLRKAAKASGNKSADLVPVKELLPLTGYVRGGCSPVGMKKRYPTYVDASASDRPCICISAGVRGFQIAVAPSDLVGFLNASVADLT